MPRLFNGLSQFSLVLGTGTSSFFGPDFAQARNKMSQELNVFVVYFLYVFFTKITIHNIKYI